MRASEPELAARDDDRGSSDLDSLDGVGAALDAREERRVPPDLDALHDLDLVAERDAAVASEMQRERAGRRAGRRILGYAESRDEHAGLPPQSVARERS